MNPLTRSGRPAALRWQQLLVIVTLVTSSFSTALAAQQPNILFVFTDDHASQDQETNRLTETVSR